MRIYSKSRGYSQKFYNKVFTHTIASQLLTLTPAQPHSDALPRGSYGSSSASEPAKMMSAPETYTGTAVARFAYSAMTGACDDCRRRQRRAHAEGESVTYEDTKDAGRGRGEAISGAAVFGGEKLGRDGVQHAVHDLHS